MEVTAVEMDSQNEHNATGDSKMLDNIEVKPDQEQEISDVKPEQSTAKSQVEPVVDTVDSKTPTSDHDIGSVEPDPATQNDDIEENGFVVLNNDPAMTPSDADRNRVDLYHELEKKLQDQITRCKHYQEVFTIAGDMTKVSQFKTFSAIASKDLDLLRIRWRNGDKFPLVKHETFSFSMVPCNTELGSNDISVKFIRGINLKVSERSYTYLKVEFPFPQESKPTAKVYPMRSSNPAYDQTVKFPLQRESRAMQRVIKRKSIEVSLYKKERFWRCDTKLGTFSIKLTDLANQCTLHDCCTVMNGRKSTDSKVEVVVKIRQALVSEAPVKVDERWLVFTE